MEYQFCWRDGNELQLLIDGPAYAQAMLDAVASARRAVALEMYLVESGPFCDRFVDAMVASSMRGVEVRMLLDGFGSRLLSRRARRRLRTAGVSLRFYNPILLTTPLGNLARDHRKLLLVDDDLMYIGGAGITDLFFNPLRPLMSCRETMLELRGPVAADAWSLFETVWSDAGGWQRSAPEPMSGTGRHAVRLISSRRLQRQEIKRSLLRESQRARHRLWLATAYFVPSWSVRRALRRAAERGVDVRVLVPGEHTDHPSVRFAGRRHYERLLRAGVQIFEYRAAFLHMKLATADDWSTLGSCNLDHWTLRWNLEANVEVRGAEFADQLARMLEKDFLQADEIDLARWRQRYWLGRLLERFTGWLDRLLSYLGPR